MKKTIAIRTTIFLLILACYAGLRSHTWMGELVHDDGLFLSGAQALARGELPYIDFWDHKPPGVFAVNALPLVFFPASTLAVKLFLCLWLSIAAFFVYLFCERYFNKITACSATLLFVFYTSLRTTVQSGGLTEECALPFVILAYWLLLRDFNLTIYRSLLAGIFIGLAIQCRQTFALDTIFLFASIVYLGKIKPLSKSQIVQHVTTIAVGMCIPELLISMFYLAIGHWWNYFEASYAFNFFYVGVERPTVAWSEWLAIQWKFIHETGPYFLSPFIALAMYPWIPKTVRWMLVPLLLTCAADLFSVGLSGEYYHHYYVQASIAFCLLLALAIEGIVSIVQMFPHLPLRWVKGFYAFTILLLIGFSVYSAAKVFALDWNKVHNERVETYSAYTFQHEVADAVRQLTYKNDRILLIGRDPNSVYFFANRLPGSRFYHLSPLWKDKLQKATKDRHRELFLNDLKEKKPLIILLDLTRLRSDDGLARVEEYVPQATDWIREHYQPVEEILPMFEDDWSGWYNIRLQILVLKEKYKFAKEHYLWQGENPRVDNHERFFRYHQPNPEQSGAAM